MLAMCGYFVNPKEPCDGTIIDQWLQEAEFLVNEISIGTLYQINPAPAGQDERDVHANCVLTSVPWDDAFAAAPKVRIKGHYVRVDVC